MKSPRSLLFLVAAIGPAMIIGAGCSKSASDTASSDAQATKSAVVDAGVDVKNAAVDSWDNIKSYTYDKRVDFSASLDRMDKSMDDKIADMKTRTSGTVSKDKDAAIKDYDSARDDLRARLSELRNATSDTWADAKAKVDAAWQRVKADYDRAVS